VRDGPPELVRSWPQFVVGIIDRPVETGTGNAMDDLIVARGQDGAQTEDTVPADAAGIVASGASAEASRAAPRCDARTLSDRAIWQQRDLDWEHLVDEARRLGPDPGLTQVSDDELEQDLCGVASQLAALTARWLDLLCELVVRGIWADQGARTPAQWLSWRVGVAPSTAREHVRIALRLRELPRIRAAFAAGELSYSKVRAMTRIAVPEIEEMVLTWAGVSTAAQLERIAADFRLTRRGAIAWQEEVARRHTPRDPDADDPRYGWSRRTLPDGTMEIRVRCPVEEGAELCAALERRLDAQAEDDATARNDTTGGQEAPPDAAEQARPAVVNETRSSPPGGRAAARVRELLSLVVTAEDRPVDTSGLDRHTLVLHAPLEELAGQDVSDPVPIDDDHGRMRSMSRSTLRRLACEAGLVLVATDGGSPIDLGRRDRRLSAALRRALRLRDRTCRFPGCHATRHLHTHHVRHWADGGPTDLDNLVLLCSHHHRFVHEHRWDIEVSRDGVHRFRPPDGRVVEARAPALPPPSAVVLPAGDGTSLRPHDVDLRFPRSQRDIIVSVLHQEIARLAPDLVAAA